MCEVLLRKYLDIRIPQRNTLISALRLGMPLFKTVAKLCFHFNLGSTFMLFLVLLSLLSDYQNPEQRITKIETGIKFIQDNYKYHERAKVM